VIEVRCRCCHRVEKWTQTGSRTVEVPGGARVPEDPAWQAMDTLVASAQGQLGAVVAVCPGCGQPMVAPGPWPDVRWVIRTSQGELVYKRGSFQAGDRPLSVDQALQWLQSAQPRLVRPDERRMSWFESALLLSMMAPVVVWVGAAMFVAVFLWRFEIPEIP
jgi:hypothetical protein